MAESVYDSQSVIIQFKTYFSEFNYIMKIAQYLNLLDKKKIIFNFTDKSGKDCKIAFN